MSETAKPLLAGNSPVTTGAGEPGGGCSEGRNAESEKDRVHERGRPDSTGAFDGSADSAALFDVRMSENRLRAEVRIIASSDGTLPTKESVIEGLRSHGVVSGVDGEAIGRLFSQAEIGVWVPVARGKSPKHGEDARLDILIAMRSSGPHEVQNSGGQMDMKDLGLIRNVAKGAVIARKTPAEPGEDGVDVKGQHLKGRKGQDVRLLAGLNTELSEDGLTLISLIDGHLIREGNKFEVKPLFEVYGDVDYSTGNLSCYGGLRVHGAVKEDFRLDARGPIEVLGVIEGAELVTQNDMILKGSVRGMGRGLLRAGGSITAVYIDQCEVSVGNDLVFQKALMHSQVKVGHCVRAVAGNRGVIVGGTLEVGTEVECQTLGNEMGTKTKIVVGMPPELAEKRDKLKSDMENLEKKRSMVEKNLIYLGKVIRRDGVNSARRVQVEKFMNLRDVILRQMELGENGMKAIQEAMNDLKQKSCVKVHGICYPGVSVSIRGATYMVRESVQEVCFVYEKGAVVPTPLM